MKFMAAFVPNFGNGELSFLQEPFGLPIDISTPKFEIGFPNHDLYSWQIMPKTYKIPQWLLGYNVHSAIVNEVMTPSFLFLPSAIPLPKVLFCTTRKRVLAQ